MLLAATIYIYIVGVVLYELCAYTVNDDHLELADILESLFWPLAFPLKIIIGALFK